MTVSNKISLTSEGLTMIIHSYIYIFHNYLSNQIQADKLKQIYNGKHYIIYYKILQNILQNRVRFDRKYLNFFFIACDKLRYCHENNCNVDFIEQMI